MNYSTLLKIGVLLIFSGILVIALNLTETGHHSQPHSNPPASTSAQTPALIPVQASPRSEKAEPRKIFAHYMGCFPGGYGPIYHEQYLEPGEREGFRHDAAKNGEALAGGHFKAWPLFPEGKPMDPVAAADLEIRRALRDGIDGFDIDAWAGSNAKQTMDTLFQAAEAGKYPFEITICIDPWCVREDGIKNEAVSYAAAIKYLLDKHGKSPNLARRDGKPLIFTYQGQGLAADNPDVKPSFDEAGYASLIEAYKKLEVEAGQPLYFYFDITTLGLFAKPTGISPDKIILGGAKVFSHYFGAIGGFVDLDEPVRNPEFMAKLADVVHSGTAEWAPPIWYQYDNFSWHREQILGTAMLRSTWDRTREQNATLLQFATWNDYGEHTTLAPTTASYYGIGDLNHYFADWWKTGQEPQPFDDRMYVSYKCAVPGSKVFPFINSGGVSAGNIEVITILKEPGKIRLPGRKEDSKPIEYQAPRGFFLKTFPLSKGAVVVELSRDGKVEERLEGHEPVTDRPFRTENLLQCASTVDEKYWNEDFPGQPFPRQSYYGDDDNDALPNWFEMYWFGKWMDFSTDTVADPNADPDGAGKTNLQSYLDQTNPTKPPPSYPMGYVWNFADILDAGRLVQKSMDSQDNPVWFYLFKPGAQNQPIDDATDFKYMTYFDGPLRAYSEPKVGGGGAVFLSIPKAPNVSATPRTLDLLPLSTNNPSHRSVALGWRSPITGAVDVLLDLNAMPGSQNGAQMEAQDLVASLENSNHEILWTYPFPQTSPDAPMGEIKVPNVKVSKDEFLYMVAKGSGRIKLNEFKVTVTTSASASNSTAPTPSPSSSFHQ